METTVPTVCDIKGETQSIKLTLIKYAIPIGISCHQIADIGHEVQIAILMCSADEITDIWHAVPIAVRCALARIWNAIGIAVQRALLDFNRVRCAVKITIRAARTPTR